MGFQGPPAVDFYSQLSGLGDVIAKNREQSAIAGAFQPGPDGTVDYNKALTTVAQYNPTLAVSMRNHLDTQKQQEIANARQAENDKFSHGIQSQTLKLAQSREGRAAADWNDETPDGFAANPDFGKVQGAPQYVPKSGGPTDPAYKASVAKAEADATVGKPIPFETLSGTRFLVRQPDGSYSTLNPAAAPAQQPQPTVQPQPTPQPNGAPAPTAGAFPQTSNADASAPVTPVAATPNQPASAAPQPADLSAIDPATGRREAWLKSQPSDVQAYIKKIADYEIDPRTTSIKGGHREQVLSAVAQYDPTYDQNTFGSRAKAIKDFSTGPQGNIIRSFDVAIGHLDLLQRAAEAMQNGDYRALNSLRNKWREQTGSDLPLTFNALKPLVSGEVAKAAIGSNNALADRQELREPLNSAGSPNQLIAPIKAYKGLMAGQLKGLKKQYEDTTGRKNFDSRINDVTKRELEGDVISSSSASSSQPNVTSTGIKWSVQ